MINGYSNDSRCGLVLAAAAGLKQFVRIAAVGVTLAWLLALDRAVAQDEANGK